jgi:hypothetical protein
MFWAFNVLLGLDDAAINSFTEIQQFQGILKHALESQRGTGNRLNINRDQSSLKSGPAAQKHNN